MLKEIYQVQATAELVFSEQEVEAALDSMAEAINKELENSNPLVLCVLNGGIVVAGKLLTRLTMPLTVDGINASRYQNKTAGGEISWLLKPSESLKDRTVLIIDDVLDAGITLAALREYCLSEGASVVYTAVLLDKMLGIEKPILADFVGLNVVDRYIFGYGMDYKGYLRNAPGIYACTIDR